MQQASYEKLAAACLTLLDMAIGFANLLCSSFCQAVVHTAAPGRPVISNHQLSGMQQKEALYRVTVVHVHN